MLVLSRPMSFVVVVVCEVRGWPCSRLPGTVLQVVLLDAMLALLVCLPFRFHR